MRGQSLTEGDATDRYKWSKAPVCVEQSCVTCSSGCKSTVSSWTCSASEVFMLSLSTISEAKSARGTPGSFNFCSFSKRSCSCNSASRFRRPFRSSYLGFILFPSLHRFAMPKLRVGTQSMLSRFHKGAAVPEWKCWSQTLSLFKIFSLRSSRLIAEIHRRLRSMLSSSTSGPWFVTTAGTRHKRIPLAPPLFLEHPTITHIGILRGRNWKKSRLSTRVGD